MLRGMPFDETPAGDRMKAAGKVVASAPVNRCTTAILSLVSAVEKQSRITAIPLGRRVFRGLGSIQLGDEWFRKDARGITAGVELGFMSTTVNRSIAMQYSGVQKGEAGTVMEFEVGAVDLGTRLDSISQYPGTYCARWSTRPATHCASSFFILVLYVR